ncbi:type VI secretion system-associated FHA domain protein TagH [Francisella marina]|uniref:Type VI secretion system-associated FHA domain protein TagH n=1 Tax=Francisella marina TaxID=2249302 RepID=A0ABX5ZFX5_9GAMM|nr:type VI secretion system-associated FHA domain protein TagH [Francisella marina]QEO57018.1 type VI secretion system-associated FHA domain protein TagH [Francisella marina]QEO58866.1 type VI secretion system-associated FHA domain protein TagH [Francisella marina]
MLTLRIGNLQDIKAEYGDVENQKTFSELGGYIGRSKDCLWSLNDHTRKISGKHMLLESQYGEFFVTDISTNGTKLNGLKLERNLPTKIKQGDILELGLYKLVVANILKNDAHTDIKHIIDDNKVQDDNDSLAFLNELNLADNNHLPFEDSKNQAIHQSRDPFEQLRIESDFIIDDLNKKSIDAPQTIEKNNEDENLEDYSHIVDIKESDQEFDFSAIKEKEQSFTLKETIQEPLQTANFKPEGLEQPRKIDKEVDVQVINQQRQKSIQQESFKGDDKFLEMLCQKLGLSYNVISQINRDKVYSDVIDILSYSVDGLIRLMMERNNAKNKLDSDLTMFTSQVKNPFKMSMSAKQALETVFFDMNNQIMPARQAVGESISEVISHFKKIDNSTREVVELMVESFDPDQIEKEVTQTGRVLPGTLASKCWSKHKVKYTQMLGTSEKQKKKNIKEYISEKYNQN